VGSPTRLAIVSPVQNVVAGACSLVTTLQSQDSFGNAVPVASNTAVALSSSSATTGFFSDSSCATAVTGVNIAGAANSTAFYFKDTRAGTPTLTGAAAGLSNAIQVETIRAGAPNRLAFTTPAQSIAAGA